MDSPNKIPKRHRLESQFRRQRADRGSNDDEARYYEDGEERRHPSATTAIERINFEEYPEDSALHESQNKRRTRQRHTSRWWVKTWYKQQLGILGHHEITNQMDVTTPDDRADAREELIEPSDERVRKLSKQELFDTLSGYNDVGLAADNWEYNRYPAEYPLLDVAKKDAEEIAYLWRTTIRPDVGLEYEEVWRGELMFVHLLEDSGWPPLGYGGQIDLVADLRDKIRAVDLKTGRIRMAHRMQAVAQQHAFSEIEGAALVHVTPTGDWEVEWSEDWPQESLWQQFQAELVLAEQDDAFDF